MRPGTRFLAVGRIFGDGQTKLSFLGASGKVTSRRRPHAGAVPGPPDASRNDISSRRTHLRRWSDENIFASGSLLYDIIRMVDDVQFFSEV